MIKIADKYFQRIRLVIKSLIHFVNSQKKINSFSPYLKLHSYYFETWSLISFFKQSIITKRRSHHFLLNIDSPSWNVFRAYTCAKVEKNFYQLDTFLFCQSLIFFKNTASIINKKARLTFDLIQNYLACWVNFMNYYILCLPKCTHFQACFRFCNEM